jgi:WD40 repeat protein
MKSNSLAWNPTLPTVLLLASEDHNLYTFDLRKMETPTQIYKGHVAGVMSCDWSESSPAFLQISDLSLYLTTTPYEQVLPEKNSYPALTTERSGCGTEIKADRGIRTIPSECNVFSIRSTRLLRISSCLGRTMGMSGESTFHPSEDSSFSSNPQLADSMKIVCVYASC